MLKSYRSIAFILIALLLAFRSYAPAASAPLSVLQASGTSFHFVFAADSRDDYSVLPAFSHKMVTLNPVFGIFGGDLCGSFDVNCITNQWKPALDGNNNDGMLAKTFVARGNHDNGSLATWQGLWDFQAMAARVGVSNYTAQSSDATYSFDYGNSHFAVIDLPGGDSSSWSTAEITWLDADLSAAEGRGMVHEFLFAHGPMYGVTAEHGSSQPSAALKAVLNKHPISAGFHGHEHVTAYTHVVPSREAGINDYEQFTMGRAGAPAYSVVKGVDWTASQNAFADIAVNGNAFTVTVYSQSGAALFSKTFTDGSPAPTSTPSPVPTASATARPSSTATSTTIPTTAAPSATATPSKTATPTTLATTTVPSDTPTMTDVPSETATDATTATPGETATPGVTDTPTIPAPTAVPSETSTPGTIATPTVPATTAVPSATLRPTATATPGMANVSVVINGHSSGTYALGHGVSQQASYPALNNGPVRIQSSMPVAASEREIYAVNGASTSFSELMALPNHSLDTTYWLPWYNDVDLDTQLRFGNVSSSSATVHVYIGGAEKAGSPFSLGSGASKRVSFAGVNNGPVKITSNVPIVAAERVIYKVNNFNTSFSEMMALPNRSLGTTYWLAWYNDVDLDTQLRFGNVSSSSATVHVYIGGAEKAGSPFTLGVGASKRLSFAGINNGPVKITSNVPIVAAERVLYKVGGINTSFSETMALPSAQLDTTYWMPWYNDLNLDTQLRFGNVSGSPAHVKVYIHGALMAGSPFTLAAGASTRLNFAGINNGPVKIVSDVPIVAAERVIYSSNGASTSFSEMLGLPNNQLDTSYWLPWYNNVDLDTQLRFGVP